MTKTKNSPLTNTKTRVMMYSVNHKTTKASLSTIEGMPLLTPHCCRVTYVSIMQSLGVKLETISHLVGRTTTRITESRYLRVQNEACQDALNRFDQRFGFV